MKTAIYLRQSLDRDENKLAIDRQREACLDLCRRKGWTDTVEYVDNDTSASAGRRHDYDQMLTDIEAGAVGAVLCYRLDRLHRQPRELEHFIDLANRHRVALATVTGDTDQSTEEGRLVARIMGAVDRAEVEKKSARQKLAHRQRAKAGKPWMQRTFGYDTDTIVPRRPRRSARPATRCSTARPCGASPKTGMRRASRPPRATRGRAARCARCCCGRRSRGWR